MQGCEYVFQDTRQTGEYFRFITRQVGKQLAKNIEKVSERGTKPSPGWRVGLCFYSPSLNSTRLWRVGEWLSAPLSNDFHLLLHYSKKVSTQVELFLCVFTAEKADLAT
jgi:hypothetical protein